MRNALLYDLEWGKDQAFFDALKAKGVEVGAGARQRPHIPERLLPYWRAFTDLHQRRQWHQSGPQPIMYAEMQAYLGVKDTFRRPKHIKTFLKVAEELDNAYLKDYAEKQDRSQPG